MGEGCTAAGEGCTAAGEGCEVGASSSLTVTIIDSWVEAVAVVTVEVVATVVGFRGVSRERGGRAASGSVWVLLETVVGRAALA